MEAATEAINNWTIGIAVVTALGLFLWSDWKETEGARDILRGFLAIALVTGVVTLFGWLLLHPVTDIVYRDEIKAERRAALETKIRDIAEHPRTWLCGRIGASPDLAVDGTVFIIEGKIRELETAAGSAEDDGLLMLYGNAIGALRRERETILEFGLKIESCGRTK